MTTQIPLKKTKQTHIQSQLDVSRLGLPITHSGQNVIQPVLHTNTLLRFKITHYKFQISLIFLCYCHYNMVSHLHRAHRLEGQSGHSVCMSCAWRSLMTVLKYIYIHTYSPVWLVVEYSIDQQQTQRSVEDNRENLQRNNGGI